MSQLLSQALDPIDASISIAKFSHNTCPYGTQNFVWTHVANRNDLDFIVRRTRVVDEHGNFNERLVMKISAGAELLVLRSFANVQMQELTDGSGNSRSRSASPILRGF